MEATAKDLRFFSKEILETVSRGEEVIITYRGKPQAKIVPIKKESKVAEEHKLFGIWNDYENVKDVEEYIRNQRKGRFNAD
jgi:prevent-host-death family protein